MAYRSDVDAMSARKTALEHELRETSRDLDELLPRLETVRVATPCPARWEDMTGDDRVRHCDGCKKNVYNLSSMTRVEAEALIEETNGRLCARYYQRADGTILLRDCEVGLRRDRRRKLVGVGIAASLAGGALAAQLVDRTEMVAGGMEPLRPDLMLHYEPPPPPPLLPPPPAQQPHQVDPEVYTTLGVVAMPEEPPPKPAKPHPHRRK